MLQTLFYIGVLTPAAIVVFLFVIFLICWFKCNLRERIYQKIGRGHNSTQSSLADTKDYMNGKMQPQVAVRQEHLENEDNESRCGSVRIINGQVVKYNRGEFPYMKRESWRYMSSKSVSKIRQEILQDKVFPPLPPIWTTAADSSSSLDSETAMTKPWLPQEGKGQGHEQPPRESQMWNNERHCSWSHSPQRPSVDNSPVNIKQQGQNADLPESSSDTSDSLGTSPAIHRENTAVRPLYFSQTPILTQSSIHGSPKRNHNYNQKTLNEKIPDKSYDLFLKTEPSTDSRLTMTANSNGCQKQLLLDSQDLGTSTDVDNIYLSVMPNVRPPIVSV
ncbi:uncharacterized protein LOC135483683 [Lineus longissimus]|uniref:uncharacterized protein LOC135483683 n=1 Tax=Lineus longissimus TaxID=88925 RepID=UPI002B4CCB9F